MRIPQTWLLAILLGLAVDFVAIAAPAVPKDLGPASDNLPGTSLFHIPLTLTTAAGTTLSLAELRGQPLIVTMFYTQCTSVCPMLTSQLQRIVEQLSEVQQKRIRVLMVSFDGSRETPASLSEFETAHHLAPDIWIVAKASPRDVRLLAAALGIKFRELADHTFNHSAILSLADAAGTIRAQTRDLEDADGSFLSAVKAQVNTLPHHVRASIKK